MTRDARRHNVAEVPDDNARRRAGPGGPARPEGEGPQGGQEMARLVTRPGTAAVIPSAIGLLRRLVAKPRTGALPARRIVRVCSAELGGP
jgi:hypothetical protein